MRLALCFVTCALVALGVRAACAQGSGPSPGQRGDPYSPLGPPTQVQTRYPLPPAQISSGEPPLASGQQAPPPGRYPLPQQPPLGGQTQGADALRPPVPPPPTQRASYAPANQPPPVAPPTELFQPTQPLAIVGDQHIFYGEVSPIVEQMLSLLLPPNARTEEPEQVERAREGLTRQILYQIINSKLAYLEFERQIEKSAGREKIGEIRANITKQMTANFERSLPEARKEVANARPDQLQKMMGRDVVLPRLAMLMKENQCETTGELDAVLRRYGSSLDKEIRLFGEHQAGRSATQKHVNIKPEITHQEMLDYYEKNAAEFAFPAKARFEILSVRFDKSPTKNEAWNTLAEMGNAVFFGTPFATVARNHSHDPSAPRGGQYDWTTQGSLASKPIDAAVFSLEPGKLSQIIEDSRGYHIVQVLERTEAGQISFLDAQADIKKALAAQKLDADYKEYVEMLRANTRIWTIYDDENAVARQSGGAVPR